MPCRTPITRLFTLSVMLTFLSAPAFAAAGAGGAAGGAGAAGGSTAGVGTTMGAAGANTGTTAGTTYGGASMGATATMTGRQNGAASWNTQNDYWRSHYTSRPYYTSGTGYSTYQPAYQYGVNAYSQNNGANWNSLNQAQLQSGWNQARGNSPLTWQQAQPAMRDAYNRMSTSTVSPGVSPARYSHSNL